MKPRDPALAERVAAKFQAFREALAASHEPANAASQRQRARRRRRSVVPDGAQPQGLIAPEGYAPTWEALQAEGLNIRLERSGKSAAERITRDHRQRVRQVAALLTSLPNDGEHERRKGWELVRRARSTLPAAERARAKFMNAARSFRETATGYAPYAVDETERIAVSVALQVMTSPDIEDLFNRIARPTRRPGHVDQGLRRFRDDTVRPNGAFPDDVTAELVAASLGVFRVGPKHK